MALEKVPEPIDSQTARPAGMVMSDATSTPVPASVQNIPGVGIINVPGYAPPAPTQQEEFSPIQKFGFGLEAFGAGFRGQEPLILKLRRQQALEQQHQQEQVLKLQQLKQQQTDQNNAQVFKMAEMLKDNPKALKQAIDEQAGKGVPAALLLKKVGMTAKDVDLITSPDSLTDLAALSPTFHAKVVGALKDGNTDTIDPNDARYWMKAVTERRDARLQAQRESDEYSTLSKKVQDGSLVADSPEADRFNELHSKRMKQRAELEKARIELKAMGSPNKGAADLAAGVKTPEAIAAQTNAEQAGRFQYSAGTEFQNGLALAMFDKSFGQLDPQKREQVIARDMAYQKSLAKIRAEAGQQAQLNIPDKPSADERKGLTDDLATLSRLDSLKELYKPEYVGPARGRYGAVTETVGGISEDEADFRAETATLRNQVIKMITGAQMSEPEAKRIMRQLPDENNPSEVFESRMKQTRRNVEMMAQKRRDVLKATGVDVSGLAPLPKEPSTKPHPKIQGALDKALGSQQ